MPGTIVVERDERQPQSAPTDTSRWFIAQLFDRGDHTVPLVATSLNQLAAQRGGRVPYSVAYDAADVAFREGLAELVTARVVGPNPVAASVDLSDGTAGTVRVTAASVGEWANGATGGLAVTIQNGDSAGTFRIIVLENGQETERSPDLADTTALIDWAAANSNLIRVTELPGTGDPQPITAAALSGGTDDRTNLTDTQWQAALDQLDGRLGPGQVSQPGRTTQTAHVQLLQHAADRNRSALLDAIDTSNETTLTTAATSLKAATAQEQRGVLLADWWTAPGDSAGTIRTVPGSAVLAGLIARSDALTGNPNVPIAGAAGQPRYATGPVNDRTQTERDTLASAGLLPAAVLYGTAQFYGWRTLIDPATDPLRSQFNVQRLVMAIKARAQQIGDRFVFRSIDGQGLLLAELKSQLEAMLAAYQNTDRPAIYGTREAPGYTVDVGPTVNPLADLQAGTVKAVLEVRPSPFAETVRIEIVTTQITEEL